MKNPPLSPRHLRLLASVLALSTLLVAGCSRAKDAALGGRSAAVPVQIAKVVRQTLPLTQVSIGAVQAQRSVAVKSQVDGVIQEIQFREGDEVKAGDLLVTLDRRPFENALRMARADLANARAEEARARNDAERYQRLDQQEAVSKETYAQLVTKAETTQAQVQAKEAAVANAELQLGYTEIRAPIAGRTGQRTLHEGALVKANDSSVALVTINQIAPISVAYAVPEGTLGALRAALAAGPVAVKCLTHDGRPQTVEGRLEFVDNAVDQTTGTLLLKAIFDNTDHTLWPGQFVDVATQLGVESGVLLVPVGAVQVGQQGAQIFVVKPDQTVDLRPVQTGRSADGFTVIRDGVREGETVVIDGQLRLVPGARVEPKTLGETTAGPRREAGAAAQPKS
jgi:multidrug efflux system membrane fusion protein